MEANLSQRTTTRPTYSTLPFPLQKKRIKFLSSCFCNYNVVHTLYDGDGKKCVNIISEKWLRRRRRQDDNKFRAYCFLFTAKENGKMHLHLRWCCCGSVTFLLLGYTSVQVGKCRFILYLKVRFNLEIKLPHFGTKPNINLTLNNLIPLRLAFSFSCRRANIRIHNRALTSETNDSSNTHSRIGFSLRLHSVCVQN